MHFQVSSSGFKIAVYFIHMNSECIGFIHISMDIAIISCSSIFSQAAIHSHLTSYVGYCYDKNDMSFHKY